MLRERVFVLQGLAAASLTAETSRVSLDNLDGATPNQQALLRDGGASTGGLGRGGLGFDNLLGRVTGEAILSSSQGIPSGPNDSSESKTSRRTRTTTTTTSILTTRACPATSRA